MKILWIITFISDIIFKALREENNIPARLGRKKVWEKQLQLQIKREE